MLGVARRFVSPSAGHPNPLKINACNLFANVSILNSSGQADTTKGETMNTTHKAQRTDTGDYIYRGERIMRGVIHGHWVVGIRGNNGVYRYGRFKTIKAACAWIDKAQ